MKIQCDVCDKDEASVFCVADEAALCAACDHRVHHANKLAGKHHRFSLHHPSPKQAPLCDICQERRAFSFCQQDRAILCRECDVSIHKVNEQTRKHARFLLTGLKLSATSTLYSATPSSAESASFTLSNNVSDAVPNISSQVQKDKPVLVSATNRPSTTKSTPVQSTAVGAPESVDENNAQGMSGGNLVNSSISASSISEYLIETLPGWHVEDLLDSTFPSPYGFCKTGENNDVVQPFWDADLESSMSAFPSEKMGLWVPQAPPPLNLTQNQSYRHKEVAFGAPNGAKEQTKEFATCNIKPSRKWHKDISFVVPQITPPLSASKRLRTLW